jgi:hypothetical protein
MNYAVLTNLCLLATEAGILAPDRILLRLFFLGWKLFQIVGLSRSLEMVEDLPATK